MYPWLVALWCVKTFGGWVYIMFYPIIPYILNWVLDILLFTWMLFGWCECWNVCVCSGVELCHNLYHPCWGNIFKPIVYIYMYTIIPKLSRSSWSININIANYHINSYMFSFFEGFVFIIWNTIIYNTEAYILMLCPMHMRCAVWWFIFHCFCAMTQSQIA